MIRRTIPNVVTGTRILLGFLLLAFPVFSLYFYLCYLLGGLTDMIDGPLARKMKVQSDFGAKLDTIADTVFAAAAASRVLPKIELSRMIWTWIGIIALIKIINILSGLIMNHIYPAVHSLANKGVGFLLFIFPLTCQWIAPAKAATFLCAFATFAAVQEGHIIRTERK